MANTVVVSTASVGMVDRPFIMHAAGGDTPIQYGGTDFRALLDSLTLGEGVMGQNALKVVPRGAGANFSVDVSAGYAAIKGDAVSNQGKYLVQATGTVSLATPGAPAAGTRNHRVIARVRDKQAGGGATTYDWTLELLEDTGSGAPAVPASAVPLALVTIQAGQSNVSSNHITDSRVQAESSLSTPVARVFQSTNGPGSNLIFNASRFKLMSVTWSDPGWPYYIEAYAQGEIGADPGNAGTRYDTVFTFDTANGSQHGFGYPNLDDSRTRFQQVNSGPVPVMFTGARTLCLTAVRVFGSGNGQMTAFNHGMVVKLVRAV